LVIKHLFDGISPGFLEFFVYFTYMALTSVTTAQRPHARTLWSGGSRAPAVTVATVTQCHGRSVAAAPGCLRTGRSLRTALLRASSASKGACKPSKKAKTEMQGPWDTKNKRLIRCAGMQGCKGNF
jgi:hypothetical protein